MKILSLLVTLVMITPLSAATLTLQEGLQKVTTKGRDVQISQAQQAVLASDVALARSSLYPQIDLDTSQTILAYTPEARFADFGGIPLSQREHFDFNLQVNQTVLDFGRRSHHIDAARTRHATEGIDEARIRNDLALQFTTAYLYLLEADRAVTVSEQEVKQLEEHLSDSQALLQEGMVTRNDVLQAEVILADARQRLVNARNARQVRVAQLNTLLLQPLDTPIEPTEVTVKPVFPATLQDEWRVADAQRPEIQVLDGQMKALDQEMKSLKADYYPVLYVAGGLQYQENRYQVHPANWFALAGLKYNIWSGGAKENKIQRARRQMTTLDLQKQKLIDGIHLSVKQSQLALNSARESVVVAEKAVAQAQENHRLQTLRYREGEATATDVTDAVTLLARAETNHWQAVYEVQRAEAALLHAMGKDMVATYTGTK